MIFDEDVDKVSSNLTDKVKDLYQIKTDHEEPEHLDGLERSILLGSITSDNLWGILSSFLKSNIHFK